MSITSQQMNAELKIQIDVLIAILGQMKRGVRTEKNNIILRECIINIVNYITSEEISADEASFCRPRYRLMSQNFFVMWKSNGSPRGVGRLKRIGVCDHIVPQRILRDRLLAIDNLSHEMALDFLRGSARFAFITKEENKYLDTLGYRQSMPENGSRYTKAKIVVFKVDLQCRAKPADFDTNLLCE